MTGRLTVEERQRLKKTILRIHEQSWGIAFGLVFGLGLMIATTVLVVMGGTRGRFGPHLGLLRFYFPGYRVTYLGSVIGFVYALVGGYGLGRMIATVYDKMTAGMR